MFDKARVRGTIVAALRISCAVLIFLGLVTTHAHGQTLTTLWSFSGSDGELPYSGLTLVGSTLYGTTYEGGNLSLNNGSGDGTVFSIATSGGSPTTLCSFSGSNGYAPFAGLTLVGSTLYGATGCGGAYGAISDGTVFSIATSGGSPTTLCSFSGSNGWFPWAGLTLVGSTLYGTTVYGGNLSVGYGAGYGTVFSIATSGGSPTTLCSFSGSNGACPLSGLTLVGSTLYGTTEYGGNLSLNGGLGEGTVFSIATSGGSPTVLCSFNGSNGYAPQAGLTLVGSTLYGTADGGGANGYGTVFSIATSGGSPTTLCSFSGSNGACPLSGLTVIGSTLYGMTYQGGVYNDGTVFSIATSGGSPTPLCSFSGSNGKWSGGGLTLLGSTLYGTTEYGGNLSLNNGNGCGTVFALTLPTSTLVWAHAGGGSWNLPGNWDGNQVPGGSTPDLVTFGNAIGSSTATVTLDGSWTLGSLTFNTTGGGSYTIACSAGDTTSTLMLTGSVTNSGGNHTIAAPVVLGSNVTVSTTAGSSLTISGPISESAVGSSLTKTGIGALVLAGSNIYSGGTEVDAGVLVVANGTNGSATGNGAVTLSGGTLASGTSGGSIQGSVQAGSGSSTIAPGGVGSVGTLTIGNLVTSSSLTLDFDLTTPGGKGDLLVITNGLTLVPHTAITFGANPTTDGDYRLIGYRYLYGDLSDFSLPAAPAGERYSLSTSVESGYIDLVVVPEPSTFVLLGVATIGLLGYVGRRKRTT